MRVYLWPSQCAFLPNFVIDTLFMATTIYIQIKAVFLLVVFSLNTMVGFACAIGVNMGFNKDHHPETVSRMHVHANGKKHHHPEKSASHHHQQPNKSEKQKGGCCKDIVTTFSQTDKSLPHLAPFVSPVFFSSFITSFYSTDISYSSPARKSVRYFVSDHHPPIPDIRIAIQSLQI